MDIKAYMEIMKWVMTEQIECAKEEANGTFATEYMEGYYAGIVRGLEVAIEKIDASAFLAKK